MKKTIVILALASIIAACGGNSNSDSKLSSDSANAADQSAAALNSEAADDTTRSNTGTQNEGGNAASDSKGAQLIAKSDCLTCHKEDTKLIGPAYKDVAKKYDNNDENVAKLADKIIKGGSGNWGDVPMTPHPSLSNDDAKEMAKYVLSL